MKRTHPSPYLMKRAMRCSAWRFVVLLLLPMGVLQNDRGRMRRRQSSEDITAFFFFFLKVPLIPPTSMTPIAERQMKKWQTPRPS